MELAAAGAALLAGVTAMSALDALDLSEGDPVLVVGATGGVGSFFVQLAAHAGATVIAPALPEDEDYLRDLGVSEMLERDADIAQVVRERHPDGVDALLDLVSYAPEGFDVYAAALKPGGRGASPNFRGWRRTGAHQRHGCAEPGEPEALGSAAGRQHPPGTHPEHLRPRSGRGGPAGVRHRAHPGQARHPDDLVQRTG